jgi:xanthosine utilization system XapX-like protein
VVVAVATNAVRDRPDRRGTGLEGVLEALGARCPGPEGAPGCWAWVCRAVVGDVHGRPPGEPDLEFETVLVRRLAHRHLAVVADAAAGRPVPRAWHLLHEPPPAPPVRLALAGVATLLAYDLTLAFAGTCTVLGRSPGAGERDAHTRVAELLGACGRTLARRVGDRAAAVTAVRLDGPATRAAAGCRAERLWRLRGRPAEAEQERDALDREAHADALRVLAGEG